MFYNIHTAPSGKPGALRVRHRTATSAQLSWTPVPKDQQNGIITGYSVQVVEPDSAIREISIMDATATSAEVSGLKPRTSYYFSISARTMAGTGPAARDLSITPQRGKAYEFDASNNNQQSSIATLYAELVMAQMIYHTIVARIPPPFAPCSRVNFLIT